MIHIHSDINKPHATFLISFVVLALFAQCLNFYLFLYYGNSALEIFLKLFFNGKIGEVSIFF